MDLDWKANVSSDQIGCKLVFRPRLPLWRHGCYVPPSGNAALALRKVNGCVAAPGLPGDEEGPECPPGNPAGTSSAPSRVRLPPGGARSLEPGPHTPNPAGAHCACAGPRRPSGVGPECTDCACAGRRGWGFLRPAGAHGACAGQGWCLWRWGGGTLCPSAPCAHPCWGAGAGLSRGSAAEVGVAGPGCSRQDVWAEGLCPSCVSLAD